MLALYGVVAAILIILILYGFALINLIPRM